MTAHPFGVGECTDIDRAALRIVRVFRRDSRPCSPSILRASCPHQQLPVTAIREMKILNELSHPSMVRLLEIVTSVGEVGHEGQLLFSPLQRPAVYDKICFLNYLTFRGRRGVSKVAVSAVLDCC